MYLLVGLLLNLVQVPAIAADVTLTMWVENYMRDYQPMIDQFEKENPGIKIEMQITTDYFNKLAVAAAAGALPDIYQVNGPDVPAYANGGWLLPLDNIIDAKVVDDWLPVSRAEATWKGSIYAVPLETNAQVLAYNTDIFLAAGIPFPDKSWTWNTLTTIASRLTIDRDSDGRPDQYGVNMVMGAHDYGVWMNLPFVQATGTDVLDASGKVVLDVGKTTQALQFMREIAQNYRAVTEDLSLWRRGNVAMIHQPASSVSTELRDFPDLNFGATLVPRPENGKWASGSGGWMLGVAASTKYPKEAAAFIRFFADTPSIRHIATKTDRAALPVRISSWPWIASEAERGQLKHLQRFPYDVVLEAMQYGVARPRTVEWPRMMNLLATMFGRAWTSRETPQNIAEQTIALIKELVHN